MKNKSLDETMEKMRELKLQYERTGDTNNLDAWMQLSRVFRDQLANRQENRSEGNDLE
jgi:hypothetical protein